MVCPYFAYFSLFPDVRRRQSLSIRWTQSCRRLFCEMACDEDIQSMRIELRPLFAFALIVRTCTCENSKQGLTGLTPTCRHIRKDLGVTNMPFVIAETGMTGPEEKHPRALSLMRAQAAVAEQPNFKGNVAFVGTKEFWRPQEDSPSGQGYHWNTNAETYYLIGESMGQAMKKLLSRDLR